MTARLLFLIALLGVGLAPAQYSGDRGARSELLNPCDAAWDHGRRAEARRCYSELAAEAEEPAVRAEAWWGLGDVKRANELFREAVKAEPENPDLRVRWGYLYLQTHQGEEALNLFREALQIDEDHVAAKLGTANVLAERFESKAKEVVDAALEAKPEQVEGYLLRARMALEEGELEAADKALDEALEQAEALGASPLEAYALKASRDLLRGVTESPWTKRALERNPLYGGIYAEPAHFYVITRRYREAVDLLQKAVNVDPELWSAHADLGVNLLRENREQEGRRHLEIAYEGDPFSAKTVNTLRLMDSFDNFQVYSSRDLLRREDELREALTRPEVIVRLHKNEAELLKPYVLDLAEKSVAEFSKKYRFTPDRPIYVELYPDHEDFAVRTMGMPGVGLLGVTFGYLVAMDSPSGRKPGSFHWGTTLWHEMAHVFTLESTNHLVPRWFSEGVSMYEEWEARPNWGERITPDFIEAFDKEKLLPVADLDQGFIRPSYPGQIAVSYFQAGLICQMIDRQFGADKLVEMLEAFARGASTEAAVRQKLGVEPKEFDKRFEDFVRDRLGPVADGGLERWRAEMKTALSAAKAEKWEDVLEPAAEAKEIYPDYVEHGSPYELRAEAFEKTGDQAAAIAELQQYFERGGRNPETLKKLAGWLTEAGRPGEAAQALDEVLYVWPSDEELHVRLGDLLAAQGRLPEALREYQAALALDPLDKASAHYRLAETYYKMEDPVKTRRHLLYALEAAPSYRPAQKLLLEISR